MKFLFNKSIKWAWVCITLLYFSSYTQTLGQYITGNQTVVSLGEIDVYNLYNADGTPANVCNGNWSVNNGSAMGSITTISENEIDVTWTNTSTATSLTLTFTGQIGSTCGQITCSLVVSIPATPPPINTGGSCPYKSGLTNFSLCGGEYAEIDGPTITLTAQLGKFSDTNAHNYTPCPNLTQFFWQYSTDGQNWIADPNDYNGFGPPSGLPYKAYWKVPAPTYCSGIVYYRVQAIYYENSFLGACAGGGSGVANTNTVSIIPQYPANTTACGNYSSRDSETGATQNIYAGTYGSCASTTLLPNTINLMKAGNSIKLLPGFTSKYESYLSATIGDPCANGSTWREGLVEEPDTTLIKKNQNSVSIESEVTIYPNPTTGRINIYFSYPQSKLVRIAIMNILGEQIYSQNLGQTQAGNSEVELSSQPDGVYIVRITADNSTTIKKIILAK